MEVQSVSNRIAYKRQAEASFSYSVSEPIKGARNAPVKLAPGTSAIECDLNCATNSLNQSFDQGLARLADIGKDYQPQKKQSRNIKLAERIASGSDIVSTAYDIVRKAPAGIVGKGAGSGLRIANAIIGAKSFLGQFSADYEQGNSTYWRTMLRGSSTIAQGLMAGVALSKLAGVATAISAGAGTVAVATAAAPVVLGLGAAVAIGYVADRAISSL